MKPNELDSEYWVDTGSTEREKEKWKKMEEQQSRPRSAEGDWRVALQTDAYADQKRSPNTVRGQYREQDDIKKPTSTQRNANSDWCLPIPAQKYPFKWRRISGRVWIKEWTVEASIYTEMWEQWLKSAYPSWEVSFLTGEHQRGEVWCGPQLCHWYVQHILEQYFFTRTVEYIPWYSSWAIIVKTVFPVAYSDCNKSIAKVTRNNVNRGWGWTTWDEIE